MRIARVDRTSERRSSPYSARWGYRDPVVARRYHKRRYRGVAGRLRRLFIARSIVRALGSEGVRSGRVLDVPCGTGVASTVIAKMGLAPIGVDISREMIEVARLTVSTSPSRWVCADVEHLPFRDGAAAAVVCLRFFAHLPPSRWHSVLRSLARATDGPIVIGLPMRESSKHRWRAFKRWLGIQAKQRPIYGLASVASVLEGAGLRVAGRLWQSPFTDTALLVLRNRGGAPDGG